MSTRFPLEDLKVTAIPPSDAYSPARLGSGRCNVTSWLPSGADEFVCVQCYTQTTAKTDSQFTLSFYQP